MEPIRIRIELKSARYTLVRLPADAPIPAWVTGHFVAVLRSEDELSIICPHRLAPEGVEKLDELRYLRAIGPFGLDMPGVIAAIAQPIALAGVSLFLLSSWSTDHFFLADSQLSRALDALTQAGHQVSVE
jgi:uncharacterized protein